jgi:hypothetical protein
VLRLLVERDAATITGNFSLVAAGDQRLEDKLRGKLDDAWMRTALFACDLPEAWTGDRGPQRISVAEA